MRLLSPIFQIHQQQEKKEETGDHEDKLAQHDHVSQSFEVLGMISLNKELFLFETPVPMVNGVESWLVAVERSMRETISKMLSYAVTSFLTSPLDEWILDFPQQIILTTLHLILSHEINEVLEQGAVSKRDEGRKNEDYDDYDEEPQLAKNDSKRSAG